MGGCQSVSQSVSQGGGDDDQPPLSSLPIPILTSFSCLHRVNAARKPRFFDGAEGGCSNVERVEGRKERRKESPKKNLGNEKALRGRWMDRPK